MKTAGWAVLRYLWHKADRAIDGLSKELSDNKVILNWLYALAYLALVFFCAKTNPQSHTAAIYATAGIVGTIFSAWVVGSAVEKRGSSYTPPPPPYTGSGMQGMTEKEQEEAAGD